MGTLKSIFLQRKDANRISECVFVIAHQVAIIGVSVSSDRDIEVHFAVHTQSSECVFVHVLCCAALALTMTGAAHKSHPL